MYDRREVRPTTKICPWYQYFVLKSRVATARTAEILHSTSNEFLSALAVKPRD